MPRQFTIYISYENEDPRALAEGLVAVLEDEPISVGQNPLSGGVELRFHYFPGLRQRIENWLTLKRAVWDINVYD
jgi:hypothetical protein